MTNSEIRIHFSEDAVEAAMYLMAASIFEDFRDQGLLTEEEYKYITDRANSQWKSLLVNDNIGTNRVVFGGDTNG